MKWRLSNHDWPDPVKPLHELTDEGLENLIWSIASEKMRRKTISERCRFFKYGKCSDGYKCKPNKKCWEK
ncbi:MAG: hypothetical protein WC373_12845 [Smithella sp.]